MLLLCRGFNSHMLYPFLSARFPWRSATPLLPRAHCPRPSACPTSMLISPYGNESGRAGQLILKRSPGPGACPPRSALGRASLGRSAACRCRGPPGPGPPPLSCWGDAGAAAVRLLVRSTPPASGCLGRKVQLSDVLLSDN